MHYLLTPLLGLTLLMTRCGEPVFPEEALPLYKPLLMSRTQLEAAVAGLPPQALHEPGKMVAGSRYLFINERYQGIHIYDNADPAHPVDLSFVRIPGNVDLAVRGTLLYADSGPDLLTLDIADPAKARLLTRNREALPELLPPVLDIRLPDDYQPANRPADAVVVGWEKLEN